jgi:chloride channel protein, CIC family
MLSAPSLYAGGIDRVFSRQMGGNTKLVLATLATGLLAGVGSVAFHYVADTSFLFTWCESHGATSRLPVVLAVPTIGLCLIGMVLQLIPESRFGGVKEVFDALERSCAIVPCRRILNVILSGLVLAFGGSVGPEGPMIQMGAVIGSQIGQRVGVAKQHLALMVQAGAAAGIAAAFRSPAGGVLLVLELFGARFNRGLAAIGVAAVVGYAARTALVGDAYPFRPPVVMQSLPLATSFLIAPLMGLLAAPTGHLFIRLFNHFPALLPLRWPLMLRVSLGGFMVGVIAIWFPQVLSAGYPVIERSLSGGLGFNLFVILLGLKMLATSITFGSGAVGGLFAPTLMIGAMYGGAFGFGLHRLLPSVIPQPELFILLGMVVMFGSIAKGYWSGLLMVADMSGCYHQLLLPGVIAGGVSFLISWEMHDRSIFGLPIDPAQKFDRVGN